MKKISKERQITYYIGNGITVIGVLTFFSFFLRMASLFGGGMHSPFFGGAAMPSFGAPIIGMVLIFIGQFVANIGRSGLAGSGVVLDPEQAREDLQPFNVAKGQMLNDTLGEIDVLQNLASGLAHNSNDKGNNGPTIKVRCTACKALNDETAKFCSSCGASMC